MALLELASLRRGGRGGRLLRRARPLHQELGERARRVLEHSLGLPRVLELGGDPPDLVLLATGAPVEACIEDHLNLVLAC